MTPDEMVELLAVAANTVGVLEFPEFKERVTRDLNLAQEDAQPPLAVRLEPDDRELRQERVERPRRPFQVPPKYREQQGSWIVFSAFVSSFIDPVAWAVDSAEALKEFSEGERIAAVTFAVDVETSDDELELSDVDRLRQSLRELLDTASEIGEEVFGEIFSLSDFWGGGGNQ